MRESRIKTLVLFRAYTKWLSYYDDWLDSFLAAPDFEVTSLNICNADARRRLRRLVKEVELTVLLHSTNADTITYLEPLSTVLQDRVGSLVCFVGDEFNNPGSPISAKRRVFGAIEPDIIATQLLVEAGEYLFGDLVRLKVVSLPTVSIRMYSNLGTGSETDPPTSVFGQGNTRRTSATKTVTGSTTTSAHTPSSRRQALISVRAVSFARIGPHFSTGARGPSVVRRARGISNVTTPRSRRSAPTLPGNSSPRG